MSGNALTILLKKPNCYYHPVKRSISFCFLISQVLPSQRQSDSSNMYHVWVCIHKKHGWILTANCSFMAGLGSACNHVAALLFKITKVIHVRETDDTSPTSILCQWKSTKKSVETALTQLVNFSRVKKDYFVCVKRITLCNCLCSSSSSRFSASRVRNIGASHIRDFRLVITRIVTFVMTFSSHQKTDSPISKNSIVKRGLTFRTKLFVILYSAMQKLNKFYCY